MKISIYKSGIIGVVVIVVLIVTGNVITIGDKIAQVHPLLAYVFYGVALFLFCFFIVFPVIKVMVTPPLDGVKREEVAGYSPSEVSQYLDGLVKTIRLTQEEKLTLSVSVDRQTCILNMLNARYEKMEAKVREAAVSAFVITAISQNGKFDFISTVIINFRMIKSLVDQLGVRPTYKQLFKLYVSVVSASIVTVAIDDVISDLDFGGLVGIQGIGLFNKGTASILSGVMNAFVTLRVGYATMDYLELGSKDFDPGKRRKVILLRARKDLWKVAKEGGVQLKEKFTKIFSSQEEASKAEA